MLGIKLIRYWSISWFSPPIDYANVKIVNADRATLLF